MLHIAIALLLSVPSWAATGQALRNHPYRGDGSVGGSFHMAVKDTLIGTTWERVTADTGFTQMSTDTTVVLRYVNDSKLDTLRTGKTHAGAQPTAIWLGGGTAEESNNANFFQDNPGTNPTAVSAVFGNGWSFYGNNYLVRREDTQFRLAGNWMLVIWVNSRRTANPAATQILYSTYESPDVVQIGVDVNGNFFGRISDDGRATWDSVGLTADRFDSTWHVIWLQTRSHVAGAPVDSLRLTVDRLVSASVGFSNAATGLNTDTAQVAAYRGASTFLGRADEAYFIEDTVSFDRNAKLHVWLVGRKNLGLSSDSAMVRWFGVGKDTLSYSPLDTLVIGAATVSDSNFSIFEAAFLDTIEPLPLAIYASGTTPRQSRLDSIPTDRYAFNPFILPVDKFQRLIIDRVTYSVPEVTMVDTVHFHVRVYPEWKRAQGAGTQFYVLPGSERAVTGGQENVMLGPWTIQGPVVVEVWARAAAASSIGQVEMQGFRAKYGR